MTQTTVSTATTITTTTLTIPRVPSADCPTDSTATTPKGQPSASVYAPRSDRTRRSWVRSKPSGVRPSVRYSSLRTAYASSQ